MFSDRDISTRRDAVAVALAQADVFFGSLLFDYDQVEWLRSAIARVPVRLVFESALELMGTTKCGTFQLDPSGMSCPIGACRHASVGALLVEWGSVASIQAPCTAVLKMVGGAGCVCGAGCLCVGKEAQGAIRVHPRGLQGFQPTCPLRSIVQLSHAGP